MSRGMTSDALSATSGEVAFRTVAVQMLFDSGALRVCGAPWNITIGGNSYLGVGELGAISTAEETADVQSTSITLQLSGIPRDAIALALAEPYQGRAATVYEVPLYSNGQPVNAPIVIFRGHIDVMSISLGASATVQLTIVNRLADWERPKISRYSDEDQRRLHPGDLGMQFAAAMESKDIVWPAASWFRSHT